MLLSDAVPKALGRKAKAIEMAVALPDISDRLSNHVSFREMFQVLGPADIDINGIVKSFAYATGLATIVQQTYYTGVRTLEALMERKRESGVYDAWEISNWEDPLPACAAAICGKYDRLPARRPPFHVGVPVSLSARSRTERGVLSSDAQPAVTQHERQTAPASRFLGLYAAVRSSTLTLR